MKPSDRFAKYPPLTFFRLDDKVFIRVPRAANSFELARNDELYKAAWASQISYAGANTYRVRNWTLLAPAARAIGKRFGADTIGAALDTFLAENPDIARVAAPTFAPVAA